MARAPRRGSEGSTLPPPTTAPAGAETTGGQDFTLRTVLELKGSISSLETKVDRLIQDVSKQSEKVDDIRSKISFVRGVIWTMGGIFALLIAGATFYVKFL
jgi:hypothetical protein